MTENGEKNFWKPPKNCSGEGEKHVSTRCDCVCRCQWRCEWQYRHLSQNRLKTSCFPVGCWHVHRILPKTPLLSAFPTHPDWKMLNLDLIHKLQPQYAAYTTCIKVEIQSFGVAPVLSWRYTSRPVKPSNSCILHYGTSDCWSPRPQKTLLSGEVLLVY